VSVAVAKFGKGSALCRRRCRRPDFGGCRMIPADWRGAGPPARTTRTAQRSTPGLAWKYCAAQRVMSGKCGHMSQLLRPTCSWRRGVAHCSGCLALTWRWTVVVRAGSRSVRRPMSTGTH